MLEAQIIVRPHGKYREGDILLVALSGHPWGQHDTAHFMVVEWEDAAIETDLRASGRLHPVRVHPYKTAKTFSTHRLDLRKHPMRSLLLDENISTGMHPRSDYVMWSDPWYSRLWKWVTCGE